MKANETSRGPEALLWSAATRRRFGCLADLSAKQGRAAAARRDPDAFSTSTATSRLRKAVTSHRTPKGRVPFLPTACPDYSPAPFAERGEKVADSSAVALAKAEGRMRGAATNANARNPSPRPSPLAPQREREKTFGIRDGRKLPCWRCRNREKLCRSRPCAPQTTTTTENTLSFGENRLHCQAMSKSLFFVSASDKRIGTRFGLKPYAPRLWNEYYSLSRRVSLQDDLGWREVQHFQRLLCCAGIWPNFPAVGLALVDAEFRPGDENQRLDLMYLRDDGGILPCELKIGGESLDSHGQLIRYMADLAFQRLNLAFLRKHRSHFLESHIQNSEMKERHHKRFHRFITEHKITNKHLRLLPQTGILIDEAFPPQLLKAVRFLNHSCGFSFRLIRAEAYVSSVWTSKDSDFLMRLDFVDIQ